MKISRTDFVSACVKRGLSNPVSRAALVEVANSLGLSYAPGWIVNDPTYKAGRGIFNIPFSGTIFGKPCKAAPKVAPKVMLAPRVHAPISAAPIGANLASAAAACPNLVLGMTGGERDTVVPQTISTYVPWGHFTDIERIVNSAIFFPIFTTGLSGNGKTTMTEQVCAKLRRECYRVNLTRQTDEDDLLGGFRLIDGNTKFVYGPVVNAMLNGGVLLLDEIDLAGPNIMCLQPVLEGKGVYLKKVNQWITPAAGFTIVATANTKGKGSANGQFIGTSVMNEAMLDRFPITLEQEYPDTKIELKILRGLAESLVPGAKKDEFYKTFTNTLTIWAKLIRQSYAMGEVSDLISTRRLCDIVRAYTIFGDEPKCMAYALNRFDDDTKAGFIALYAKLNGTSLNAETMTDEDLAKSNSTVEATPAGAPRPISTKAPF